MCVRTNKVFGFQMWASLWHGSLYTQTHFWVDCRKGAIGDKTQEVVDMEMFHSSSDPPLKLLSEARRDTKLSSHFYELTYS